VNQLVAPRRGNVELVDAFDEQALAIAASCAAPNTRLAYATAYRAFAGFLRARYGVASRETFTLAAVAAWRDELASQGLAPSSVAQRVSAVRRLAAAIGADALVQQVRCTQIQHKRPRALSDPELSQLLARPDRRSAGVRDDRRTAHALRHTVCTMLAERGVALEVIRELAGHVDVRTTQIYVDVTNDRKADAIAALERPCHPLAA